MHKLIAHLVGKSKSVCGRKKADDTATSRAPVFTEPWVFLLGAYCHMGASPDNTVEACLFSRYTRSYMRGIAYETALPGYYYERAPVPVQASCEYAWFTSLVDQ